MGVVWIMYTERRRFYDALKLHLEGENSRALKRYTHGRTVYFTKTSEIVFDPNDAPASIQKLKTPQKIEVESSLVDYTPKAKTVIEAVDDKEYEETFIKKKRNGVCLCSSFHLFKAVRRNGREALLHVCVFALEEN